MYKKKGISKNSAGLIRNAGIKLVTTEWVGFVDDDDIITPHYISHMKDEIAMHHDVECIIFRMIYPANEIPILYMIPPPYDKDIHCAHVGISFCYKTKLFNEKMYFIPSDREDFLLLRRIRANKNKIIISPFITYLVRPTHLLMNIIVPFFKHTTSDMNLAKKLISPIIEDDGTRIMINF